MSAWVQSETTTTIHEFFDANFVLIKTVHRHFSTVSFMSNNSIAMNS